MNYYIILLKQPSNVLIALYNKLANKNTIFAQYIKTILDKRNIESI